MPGRLVLLTTTHRVAAGLLTAEAWDAVRAADVVLAEDGHPLRAALAAAGVEVATPDARVPLGAYLVSLAADTRVVWLSGVDGDPGLAEQVATAVLRASDLGQEPPEVEVLLGSWDVPGARLLDLVAVMDRLRSPGGCPWDAEQTHESLVTYLLEEAYETVESVETERPGWAARGARRPPAPGRVPRTHRRRACERPLGGGRGRGRDRGQVGEPAPARVRLRRRHDRRRGRSQLGGVEAGREGSSLGRGRGAASASLRSPWPASSCLARRRLRWRRRCPTPRCHRR